MKDLVNPENEIRDGYFISHEMKKVWNIQLDMFQKLIDVCKQYNLRIWCDGGTLLGAIRHHGYIPWDDDIDLCMPRPDYDRLQEISPKVFREPYFFLTAKTDKHYYRGHAQLRRSDTAAIRPSDSYRPFNQGIFIDIFAFFLTLSTADFGTTLSLLIASAANISTSNIISNIIIFIIMNLYLAWKSYLFIIY